MPKAYSPNRMRLPLEGKKALTKRMYTGRRALQDMKGTMNMVIIRLLRLSMVRVAMMAGTLQPKPMMRGMNDLPWRPMRCITLSMMKAARAM